MIRSIHLLLATAAYLIFFLTFLYLIAFVGDFPFVPITVDRGTESAVALAVPVNLALIALFGLQHSIMARQGFKRAWIRLVPPALERSTYVLASSLVLILLFLLWRPIPGALWTVTNPAAAGLLWTIFGLGWGIVLLSTFLISHFELFGLTQAFLAFRKRSAAPAQFRQPLLYRFARHPLYAGFLLALWATPAMSFGHALLALGLSAYILVGVYYEERDLVGTFGADYEAYREKVGMFAPRIVKRKA